MLQKGEQEEQKERAEKAEKAGQEGGKEQQELGGGEAFFMGLGDAIIPAILAVSAYRYASFASAIGSVAGTLAGYALLCTFAGRGKPHAGLPFLNSGAILGFLLGVSLGS
nr:presenilin family intramembrane aspartyl protease [Methanophagales archaeon]